MKYLLHSIIVAVCALTAALAFGQGRYTPPKPKYVSPSTPSPGQTVLVPPTPGVVPRNMPDASRQSYGLPPVLPAEAGTEAQTVQDEAADIYPNSTTTGSVSTPAPTPPPTPPADIPPVVTPYGTSSTNNDCNITLPCFAGVTAYTTGNSIITSSNFISFTVPYLVARGSCPTAQSMSIWVGNQYGGNLWQAGVTLYAKYDAACNATNWAFTPFYEDWPTQPTPMAFPGVTATPGDKIYVSIWNVDAHTAKASFSNLTKATQTTISYGTKYNMVNPTFLWQAETHGVPPKFGALQVLGIATDQSGKMYRAGDNTNGNTVIVHMINSGASPSTWIPITGVGLGVFTFNGT